MSASIWTSLKDPPTVEIVRAALVMNVRAVHALVLRNSMLCGIKVCNLLQHDSKQSQPNGKQEEKPIIRKLFRSWRHSAPLPPAPSLAPA